MKRLGRRAAAALGLALTLIVLLAGPAAAHDEFESSTPADGSTVDRLPTAVVLTFAEPAVALGTQVVVTGPDGAVSSGPAQLVDNTVRQPLAAGPAGRYSVDWRVTSDDGHPITGQLTFTATAAGGDGQLTASAPAPAPAQARGWANGVPIWVATLVLVVAVSAVTAAIARRRHAADADSDPRR